METVLVNLSVPRGVVPKGKKDAIWYGPGLCEFPAEAVKGLKPEVLLPVPPEAQKLFDESKSLTSPLHTGEGTAPELPGDEMDEAFGRELAAELRSAGFTSVSQVRGTPAKKLASFPNIGVEGAKRLKFTAPK